MTAYEQALETSGEAIRVYRKAQADYRARTMGDVEFLAARKIYVLTMAEFDKAFAAESEQAEA